LTEASIPNDEPWPWHPDIQEPVCPIGGNPVSPSSFSKGEGVGGEVSLVQYSSITVTAQIHPSDIAKSALDNLGEIDPEYCNSHDFVEYLQMCEQKGFRIKGYDTRKGKIVSYPLEYNNRWGKSRRMDLGNKLKRLEHWFELQEDRPVTLVTLTSYHSGYSISGAWQELNKSRDKLRKLIFKYFGAVDYFWVVEPHQDGYAHYHMAVFASIDNDVRYFKHKHGIDWFIAAVKIEDKFRDIWSKKYKTGNHTYGLDFAQKKDGDKIKKLKAYLQKYLAKGFLLDKWTPGMLKFNAAMWDTGFRMYGASKNIREIMNILDDKQNQTVWLETKIQEPKMTEEGEEFEDERVVWYRQYIPDWIDSDIWLLNGIVRQEDPPPMYIFDWGRHASNRVECRVIQYQPRKKEEGYAEFNKEMAKRYIRT
jgi:hypothetical protein